MKRFSPWLLVPLFAPALSVGCRADNPAVMVVDDAAAPIDLAPVDSRAPDNAPVDAPADLPVDTATPPMDASLDAPSLDAPSVDAAADAPTDVRADVAADRPRDAGRVCVCQPLPTTCTPSVDAPAFSPETALLSQIMSVIACANTSLHIAMYETLWNCVPNAIAERLMAVPELTVQLVYDAETCPSVAGHLMCPLSVLEGNPRVTLVPDGRTALMHDKFMVVDGARVWVGSANSSETSFCTDGNDAIVIAEAPVVTAFENEFQRMFRDRMFGPIDPESPVTSGRYTVYFSPRSPATNPARWFVDMVNAIGAATTSVDFIIASWTRTEISDALLAARTRGVTVRGVVAPEYINAAPALALRMAGVPVRVGDVHSKVLLIDGQIVITGSANWSAAAWANNENSVWIRDASTAMAYRGYFDRQYTAARTPAMP